MEQNEKPVRLMVCQGCGLRRTVDADADEPRALRCPRPACAGALQIGSRPYPRHMAALLVAVGEPRGWKHGA